MTDKPLIVGDLLGLPSGPVARNMTPERRGILAALMDAPRYYAGPTGVPERLGGLLGALEYTDAGDVTEAAKASRELWNNPSLGSAGRYATAATAMMLPAVSAKMVNDGVDVAGDLGRFWADESGAVGPGGPIKAYHGSPHDFDRFQMDKIGTGEGAQAYGHGLYFAESEDVARNYRDALRGTPGVEAGKYGARHQYRGSLLDKVRENNPEFAGSEDLGRKVDNLSRALWNHAEKQGVNPRVTVKNWLDEQERFSRGLMEPPYNNPGDDLAIVNAMREMPEPVFVEKPGSMYEVNIHADPDDFLDWDAPVGMQGERVKKFAQERVERVLPGRNVDSMEGDMVARLAYPQHDIDGRDWLDVGPDVDASNRLRDAGIPGIKYRDQFSRGTDGGTRNYVVFDENLIEIVRKYGIAGAAAALGVSAGEVEAAMGQNQ